MDNTALQKDVSCATCLWTWRKAWCYSRVSCLASRKSAPALGHYTTFPSWNGLSTEMDGEPQQSLEASGTEALTDGSGNIQACNDCQVTSDLMLVSNCIFTIFTGPSTHAQGR